MADPEIVIGDGGAKKFSVAQATLVDADPYLSVAEGVSVVSLPTQKSVKLLDPEIQALIEQGFPSGLARAMNTNTASLPLRIWVRVIRCLLDVPRILLLTHYHLEFYRSWITRAP
jgi:hypothetical protein